MSEFAFILDSFPFPLLADETATAGSWWNAQWQTLRSLQFDLPTTGGGWAAYLGGFALALVVIVWMYLRDTAMLGGFWRFWLLGLRVLVVAALAVIALNPHFREEETLYRPSQVAVLIDTSFSMRLPADPPPTETQPEGSPPPRSRADAAIELFAKSPMLRELRQRHEVHVYTFDSRLEGPHRIFKSDEQLEREARLAADEQAADAPAVSESTASAEANGESDGNAASNDGSSETDSAAAEIAEVEIDWEELLAPRGQETRLGEALYELVVKMQGDTLSGIMVLSDGGSNAGYDPRTANEAAVKSKPPVKLVAVGVGSTEKQPNLRVANLQAPTQVHMGDPFDLVALVSGNEMAGRGVDVELLVRTDDRGSDEEPRVVARQSITLAEDGVPVEVAFRETPALAGKFRYSVQAKPTAEVRELRDDDNRMDHVAEVVDRKTRVLIVAGGPTREYQFVRNMLYRHSGVELDIWLQTVDRASFPRVSQEADELLIEFPKDRAELFQYDVIVAFDPDWRRIPAESLKMLEEWVFAGSGLIAVAGDVYTPEMVGDDPALEPIRTLYPVSLRPYLLDLQFDREADQAYSVAFTDSGRDAGFLQIVDDPAESRKAWDEFAGFYGVYPTGGAKAGATVYAHFSDARSQNQFGLPILMAGQLYGAGRSFYLGSGEMWRIRREGEEYYDRFWTKLVRDAAQGRFRTGGSRAQFVLDRNVYSLGETVRVRVRLHDAQYQPVGVAQVPVQLFDPNGRPRVPPLSLERDPHRPGQYVGEFRANSAGNYELELAVPDSTETENASIQVRLPNLEDDDPEQNAALLADLVRDTGGRYIPIEQAAVAIPGEFDFKGSETTISEQLQLAWDKAWVMYVLIGLLSVEWLTRKLLKLA